MEEWSQCVEGQVCATAESRSKVVILWPMLRVAGMNDREYLKLLHAVTANVGEEFWDEHLRDYKKSCDQLTSVDKGVLYDGRTMILTFL